MIYILGFFFDRLILNMSKRVWFYNKKNTIPVAYKRLVKQLLLYKYFTT